MEAVARIFVYLMLTGTKDYRRVDRRKETLYISVRYDDIPTYKLQILFLLWTKSIIH